MALNDTLDQMDSGPKTDHPKTAEHTFLSSAHGTFSREDYILGHKTSLNKDLSHTMYLFWPQCYETRTQPQENNLERPQIHGG